HGRGPRPGGSAEDQSQKNPNDCAIIDPWPPLLSSTSSPVSLPGMSASSTSATSRSASSPTPNGPNGSMRSSGTPATPSASTPCGSTSSRPRPRPGTAPMSSSPPRRY